MKVIMLMYDSLNRHFLSTYGNTWVKTPNFERLKEKSVMFTKSYAGSMPCMPARRELHTGRYNFLHRSWGPIEPFDDSMPEILWKQGNVHTHLISDHYHYWEDGGATYHTRYKTWEISRGQEGDPWKGDVKKPEIPEHIGQGSESKWNIQDWINRQYMKKEEDMPQAKTFAMGLEFLEKNHKQDNWFLHLETFDPHEPFYVLEEFKKLYPDKYKGPHFDWPIYKKVDETPEQMEHLRKLYASLVSMCDFYLGKLLDAMDKYDLWKDTMLIVNTDHGYALGEHNWTGKCFQPFWEEVIHTPLFIWDPRSGRKNETCDCLAQTIDLAPTILEFFGFKIPKDMEGKPLKDAMASGKPVRKAALFGILGGQVNCTDGRYVYMRSPVKDGKPVYDYTLMTTKHMSGFVPLEPLRKAKHAKPFDFTKGVKVLKIPRNPHQQGLEFGTLLYDLEKDPMQEKPISDPKIEKMMIKHMVRLMKENDAPAEQYKRLGLK